MAIRKEEASFPRGRSSSAKPALRRANDKLFKKYKRPRKKIRKNTFSEEKLTDGLIKKNSQHVEELHSLKSLTYQSLEEGMIVLGRIREIMPYHMFINLPGRLSAKVPVAAISAPYTDALKRLHELKTTQDECPPLNELFTVGQCVVCGIVEIKKERDVLAVSASLDPSVVNQDRSHHTLKAGHVIVAAVQSEEDHGYTLQTGITGLTAFLRRSNTTTYVQQHNQGRPLVIGELLRCLVTKCSTGRSASRVEVTVDPEKLAQTVLSDVHTQTLHPGSKVRCYVEQASKKGLVVTVGKGKAYIEDSQLATCWDTHKFYKPQTELKATVLYVLPHSDFQISSRPTYLTLKDVNKCVVPRITIGEVVEAKVTRSFPKGVFVCLGNTKDIELGNKGFISVRRLGENIDKEAITKKFPKGKVITTKILAFDYMEEIYNCSLERTKLEQKYVKIDQLKIGDRVTCQVYAVENKGLRLVLGSIRLFAPKEHCADEPISNLHQYFAVGDIVDGRVLNIFLKTGQVLITLKETLIRSPMLSSYDAAHLGDSYWGTVRQVLDHGLLVTFFNDIGGLLPIKEVDTPRKFVVGQLVKCYITYVNAQEQKLWLSMIPKQPQTPKVLTMGESYQLVVSAVHKDYLAVNTCDYDGIEGVVLSSQLHNIKTPSEGDFMNAWLYFKKGETHYFSPNPTIKSFLKKIDHPKVGHKLTCCVEKVTNKKIYLLTPLSDFHCVELLKNKWQKNEEPELHQIVHLFIKSIDADSKTLVLSCKKTPKSQEQTEGDKVMKFKKVEKHNHKILSQSEKSPSPSKQNDETSENENQPEPKSNDLQSLSNTKKKKQNHQVTGEQPSITSVNSEDSSCPKKKKQKIEEISTKSKASEEENCIKQEEVSFTEKLSELDNISSGTNKKSTNKKKKKLSFEITYLENNVEVDGGLGESEPIKNNLGKEIKFKSDTLEADSSSDEDSKKLSSGQLKRKRKALQKLKNTTLQESGFLWDIKPDDLMKPVEESVEDIDEDDEDTNKTKKRKTPAERRRAAKEEEARLREVEKALLESESNPQTVDQFDRAVLARPDDDELWIKYMSYHLQATEIEKARAVARRALQTINHRNEIERINVWIALLNLENLFGSQESLKNTFDEALRTNDEYTVYSKMLQIYTQANKAQEAEQMVNTMVRKFRNSLECWVSCCTALMKCGLPDKARNMLQRAVSALPNKDHINLLCKFALLENQCGFSDQSQTLFEHILTSYPKRTDVWFVYVDMLVKSNKFDIARQILERATRQKLPPRKMKMLFTKWISFEEKNGTPEKVEYVRKQALAYVNNITAKLE